MPDNDHARSTHPQAHAGLSRLSRRSLIAGATSATVTLAGARHLVSAQTPPIATPAGTPVVVGDTEWANYANDPGGMRHSSLTQINPANVASLDVAWTYQTGELATYEGTDLARNAAFEATPLMVDGTLFLSTPTNRVIALDARTGTQRWVYDPVIDRELNYSELTSRGVSTWTDPAKQPGESGYRRIFAGTIDGRLLALDAESGQLVDGFGEAGIIDLTQGVGEVEPGQYNVTSPPAVTPDLIIVGSAIGDNRAVKLERGIVRAYDVQTGELRWSWDPIPRQPGDAGFDTWQGPVAHLGGGANAWPPLSLDLELDLVLIPTSAPSPDYYGGERLGRNEFANSVVALRASTGELVWNFQTVHHDVWDYDVPMQPLMLTLERGGEEVPAVAIGTKMGHIFIMHRETGEQLFAVEERPVPQTTVPGEATWETQPFPAELPVFGLREVSPDEAFGFNEEAIGAGRERIASLQFDGIFTPPSLEGTIQAPSNLGGFNWGGLTYDPARGMLVGATNRIAAVVTLYERDVETDEADRGAFGFEIGQQLGTPYRMERSFLIDPEMIIPYTPPPWGTLAAVNLTDGSLAWEVPLGLLTDPAEVPEAVEWGMINLGGPLTTAGGLTFIGATFDSFFRVFDTATGEMLWQTQLPAGGQATPMSYALDGRQYVVIAAGGHGSDQGPIGDSVVAFALPESV